MEPPVHGMVKRPPETSSAATAYFDPIPNYQFVRTVPLPVLPVITVKIFYGEGEWICFSNSIQEERLKASYPSLKALAVTLPLNLLPREIRNS